MHVNISSPVTDLFRIVSWLKTADSRAGILEKLPPVTVQGQAMEGSVRPAFGEGIAATWDARPAGVRQLQRHLEEQQLESDRGLGLLCWICCKSGSPVQTGYNAWVKYK